MSVECCGAARLCNLNRGGMAWMMMMMARECDRTEWAADRSDGAFIPWLSV